MWRKRDQLLYFFEVRACGGNTRTHVNVSLVRVSPAVNAIIYTAARQYDWRVCLKAVIWPAEEEKSRSCATLLASRWKVSCSICLKTLFSCSYVQAVSQNSPPAGKGRRVGSTRWRFWRPEAAPPSSAESLPARSPSPASPAQEAPHRTWQTCIVKTEVFKPLLSYRKQALLLGDLLGDDAADLQQTETNLPRLLMQHYEAQNTTAVAH